MPPVNFVKEEKVDLENNHNYKYFTANQTGLSCEDCIFLGCRKNNADYLCAENMKQIAKVWRSDVCDAYKPSSKWYNQINPIKKLILWGYGFKFINR